MGPRFMVSETPVVASINEPVLHISWRIHNATAEAAAGTASG